ncbi:hypothetical protein BU16DRAFT_554280 [Lophium mytilinum]|uniref:Uncharacterized protein n=1 Tax=Lophium mytilinum TaxID=390894 RepID=A0A6A6RFG8_9PEZI|nr:hypothetical protein BU16DRAFT_554280 [Lophium mytilinum]
MAADRLIALSGIAVNVSKVMGDYYLAGLWLTDIKASLAWEPRGPGCGWLPDHYRAPSWSWASVEGPIKYTDDTIWDRSADVEGPVNATSRCVAPRFIPQISIRDFEMNASGKEKTGQVTSGSLTLRGSILGAELEISAVEEGMDEIGVVYTFTCHGSGRLPVLAVENFSPDVPLVENRTLLVPTDSAIVLIQRSRLRPRQARPAVRGLVWILILGVIEEGVTVFLVLTPCVWPSYSDFQIFERLGVGRGRCTTPTLARSVGRTITII